MLKAYRPLALVLDNNKLVHLGLLRDNELTSRVPMGYGHEKNITGWLQVNGCLGPIMDFFSFHQLSNTPYIASLNMLYDQVSYRPSVLML